MDTAQSKSRLLLVDGDPKSLRVLDVSLKKAGFDVTTATSGREALTLLETSLPDLIISDTDLGEMDGFELCRQIKARPEWAKIPFLFVSGRKSIEDKIRGLELGVEDYLSKPIYIKEIGIRVRTALQRAERERMESRREGRTRFAGDLSDVGVVDLVQTIEVNRKSGIIHIVNRDNRRGSIFFREGKVIDAEVGRLSGANALYRLFSWSEGRFAVEFKHIRRHDIIDTPMAPLLMEGMRRLDETTRLLEKLPSARAVLEVDCRVLAEELAELPDEMNSVLRLCDGTRTLQEVVEDSDHPDLEALTIISNLFAGQIVFAREGPDRGGESEPGERLARWLAEGGAEDGVAAEDANASAVLLTPKELADDAALVPSGTPAPTSTLKMPAVTLDGNPAGSADPLAVPTTAVPAPASPTLVGISAAAKPIAEELAAEETLGAALSPQDKPADADQEGAPGLHRAGDTLKGVPVETVFGEDAQTPEATARAATDQGSTRPPGLAERMLSDDSAVRASAMHEAISDGDGRIASRLPTDRNTREYGSPEETAAALVDEVVSSAHEAKREPPAEPERPSKVVDWGAWPTGPGPRPGPSGTEPPPPRASPPPPPVPSASNPESVRDSQPARAHGAEADHPAASDTQRAPAGPAEDSSSGSSETVPVGTTSPPSPSAGVVPAASDSPPRLLADRPLPSPPPDADAAESAMSLAPPGASYRQLWLLAIAAFVAGAVGFLALFGRGADSSSTNATSGAVDEFPSSAPQNSPAAQPAVPTAKVAVAETEAASTPAVPTAKGAVAEAKAASRPAVPAAKVAVAEAKASSKPAAPAAKVAPPAASAVTARPNPAGTAAAKAALAAGAPTPSDLHRKCLEVDADGRGRAKAVAKACRPALVADPKDVEVMVVLARAELDRGRLVEARSLARKALATDPNRFDAYIYIGNAEQEAGRIDEARAAYKKYLELAPNGPFAHELRAILDNL
jgi:CheY-like chemotaxis protein